MAALKKYLKQYGVRLAVLVDRGEPEFPIRADFIGMKFAVPPDHKIQVRFVIHIVEPHQKLNQCGLSGTGGTDDGDGLTRFGLG